MAFVVGAVLGGFLLTGCAVIVPGTHDDAPTPSVTMSASVSVDTVLATRADAIVRRDGAGMRATQAPGASAGVRDLPARLAELPLTEWTYVIESDEVGPSVGERTVTAVLHYRLSADPSDVTARRRLILSAVAGWRIVTDEPVGAALPWDLGVVHAVSGEQSDVLSVGAPADLSAAADDAARAVSEVWGTRWRRNPVLVTVPGPAGLAALTGRPLAGVTGLVAVATTDRVYVDTAAYTALDPAGRQVLLTHEVTHLATVAGADRATPQWLKEGFADYVGFLHSGIGVDVAASTLLARVRRQGPPASAPDDASFSPGSGTEILAQAYAGAWLFCVLLAQRDGQAALVAVYRETASGSGSEQANVDAALRKVTGRTLAAWTTAWAQDLNRRAA